MNDILLYGIIGIDWWTGEGLTARWLQAEINARKVNLKEGEKINVRINGPGGDIGEGIAMWNILNQNADILDTVVDGIAFSMHGCLAFATGLPKVYQTSVVMLHNCWGCSCGNAQDMRASAEMMDAIDSSMIASVAAYSGKTPEEVKSKYFNYADHTFSAEQLKAEGLCGEIIPVKAENVPANPTSMTQNDLMAYYAKAYGNEGDQKGFMARFANKLADLISAKTTVTPKAESPENSIDMKIKATAKMLNVLAQAGITAKEGEEVEVTAETLEKIEEKLAGETAAKDQAEKDKNTAETNAKKATDDLADKTKEYNDLRAEYEKMPGAKPTTPKAGADKIPDDEAPKGIGTYGDDDADYNQTARAMFGK